MGRLAHRVTRYPFTRVWLKSSSDRVLSRRKNPLWFGAVSESSTSLGEGWPFRLASFRNRDGRALEAAQRKFTRILFFKKNLAVCTIRHGSRPAISLPYNNAASSLIFVHFSDSVIGWWIVLPILCMLDPYCQLYSAFIVHLVQMVFKFSPRSFYTYFHSLGLRKRPPSAWVLWLCFFLSFKPKLSHLLAFPSETICN